jgi:hypothetical protein
LTGVQITFCSPASHPTRAHRHASPPSAARFRPSTGAGLARLRSDEAGSFSGSSSSRAGAGNVDRIFRDYASGSLPSGPAKTSVERAPRAQRPKLRGRDHRLGCRWFILVSSPSPVRMRAEHIDFARRSDGRDVPRGS